MMKHFAPALSLLLLCTPFTASSQQEENSNDAGKAASDNLYINVGQANVKKSLTAITPIKFLGTPALAKSYLKYEKELQDVIEKDLTVSTFFQVQSAKAFVESADKGLRPAPIDPNGFDFGSWKAIGTEFLVKTGFNVAGDTLNLETYVYNISSRELVMGKQYTAPLKDTRSVAHKFCNDIVEKLTGKKSFYLTKAVVSRSTGKAEKEIFVMDWDGANQQAVTNSKTIAISPTWSPNGRYIAYSAFSYHKKTKMRNADLFLYDMKTRERSVLSAGRGINSTLSFMPDQRSGIFRRSLNNASSDLYKMSLSDPSHVTAVTNGPRGAMNVEPAVSPDGEKLAFSSDRSGKAMIYVQDITGGGAKRLTFAGSYNASPSWSPDGKRITFMGDLNGHFDIYIIDADGKNLQKLTSAKKSSGRASNNEDPSFSPDGRFIMFRSDRTGAYQIYVVSIDGKHEYRITFDNYHYYRPQWSPFLQ